MTRLLLLGLIFLGSCCPCPRITDMRIVGWVGESKILLYDPATGREVWVRRDSLRPEDLERFLKNVDN